MSQRITQSSMQTWNLGGQWQLRRADHEDWMPAEVPGEVHTALLSAKRIPDPFYGCNEVDLQWIDKVDWQYRTSFELTADELAKDRIELAFRGLDTYADVLLNDRMILQADNYHRIWQVDVKDVLRPGRNTLLVHLHSPITRGLALLAGVPFIGKVGNDDHKTGGVAGQVSVFTRKPHYHYGWDWGPRFVTSGIHDAVLLRAWNSARIDCLQCVQQRVDANEAVVDVGVALVSDRAQTCTLSIGISGQKPHELTVKLHEGPNRIQQAVSIDNPQRWWPNGLGRQHLYMVEAVLAKDGVELDRSRTRIGLRSIRLVRKPDTDGEGSSFTFEVNGVRVFMKGANYIPQDNFITRPSADTYRRLLDSTVAANMNMLRIWGGGIYEKDLFYDLCDERGILVWQDFMFANRDYHALEGFYESITAEARDVALRLRNHACLALWCGNNEMAWQHQAKYKDNPKHQYFSQIYQRIFHEILPAVVAEHDPATPYWPSSPTTSPDGGTPKDNHGDQHNWEVWHGEKPFDQYETAVPRFMSEYGFQSFPALETLRTFSSEADWDIDSPVMKAHQKNGLGNRKIKTYLERYYREPRDFPAFVYLSQVQQAEAIRVGIEAHRRAKPWCMGSLYWQLNDCWPVASWSSLDSTGDWKALHYLARDAFAPYLISCTTGDDVLKVHIVSDTLEPLCGTLNLRLLDFHGKERWQAQQAVTIPANSSACYLRVDLRTIAPLACHDVFLHAILEGDSGRVAEKSHYFRPVRDLALPPAAVAIESRQVDGGYDMTLRSDVLAKSVCLSVPSHRVSFDDNYFDLLPGHARRIRCRTDEVIADFESMLAVTSLTDACDCLHPRAHEPG